MTTGAAAAQGAAGGLPLSGSLLLDLLLVLLLVGYAGAGFRQGLVVGLASLVGFVGAALLAARLLPGAVPDLPPGPGRSVLLLVGALLAGVLGQALLGAVALAVRRRVTWQPARAVDAVTGMVASVVAVGLVVWAIAGAVRVSPFPTLSQAVAGSRVVAAVDRVVPDRLAGVLTSYYDSVSGDLFPRAFVGEAVEPLVPVEAPDAAVLQDPAVVAAGAGVVRVTGVADACRRGQEGSGWVIAPERVVTNAHVVAGVAEPQVQVGGTGERLAATVVVFDPERDLAVLAVPGLQARPLPVGTELARGDEAVVAGFPLNGPYVLGAARVRDVVQAVGEDIYGGEQVTREVYSLNAQVRPGNSGGPVLDGDGAVVGVVFARSLRDAGTGYAVTLEEAAPVLDRAGATDAVPTGDCAPG
ncbi:MarP family serine protease [Aquipuribacter sp. SD81]|uniref:MarP family serine protease n=1 Tax=Aquipuribacter sp. SD81 TaxID=3127703 RepID=UPI003019C8C7